MGGDANIASERAGAQVLSEGPPPPNVRIRFSATRMSERPLSRLERMQNTLILTGFGQMMVRRFRRLRPGSRLRRLGYRNGVALTLKSLLARDRDGLACFYEPDADIIVPPWPGLAERYTGPDGFMDFFEAWTESWDQVELELTEVIDLGDVSVVFGLMHTRGGASGVATRQPYSAVFHYTAAKISRGEWFMTWEAGMEAAGLEGEPLPG
jgi:ketosteroid isomerase-like protein